MASTQPGVQTSTVIVATIGTITTAALAYAVYFDYKRRSDPGFRRSLKKQQKQLHRAAKEEAVAAEKGQKERVRAAVDEANEEGFPKDPEKTEEYFMTEVSKGEAMCQDGESGCIPCACPGIWDPTSIRHPPSTIHHPPSTMLTPTPPLTRL